MRISSRSTLRRYIGEHLGHLDNARRVELEGVSMAKNGDH